MTALFLSLLTDMWKPIMAGLAGLVAIAGVYLKARSSGAAAERAKQEQKLQQAAENKRKLDDEIDNLGPADIDQRAQRWVREDGR